MNFKNLFFLTFLVSIFLISCGDDEDMTTADSDLDGTWVAQTLTADVNSTTVIVGGLTVNTDVDLEGKNLDYTLVLDNGAFTTTGSYDIELNVESQGINTTQTDTYTDVSGGGSYTISGDQISVNGQFFDLEFNGMPLMISGEEQSATYVINGNTLTISQDETSVSNSDGVSSTTETVSVSTWTKQ